jgi:hypothetical protein
MYSHVMATSVAKVAGANAKTIRLKAKVTLDQLAIALKLNVLRWSTGRVGSFESGHVPARLETLYTVALALSQATGRRVTLPDLLVGDDEVTINAELSVPVSALRDAVAGKPVKEGQTETARKLDETLRKPVTRSVTRTLAETMVRAEFREADFRACKRLGVAPERGALAMGRLWAHTFSRERDIQAGPGALAQHRGNISRHLQEQLRAELQKGSSRGDH